MSACRTHACFESHTPLTNGCVYDVLLNAAPNVQQTLSQFVNISNLCPVDALLHCSPDFVVHWVKICDCSVANYCYGKIKSGASLDVRAQLSHEHGVLECCPAETRTHSLISAWWLAITSVLAARHGKNKHCLFSPAVIQKTTLCSRVLKLCMHQNISRVHVQHSARPPWCLLEFQNSAAQSCLL